MLNNTSTDQQPGEYEQVLVRCAGFRCLAYRDQKGEWRSVFGGHRIPEVLEVVSTLNGEAAPEAATGRIDMLLDRIDKLPAAPRVMPRLLNALSEPETDLDEIVDLVALDTVLTAKLLRTCNSAYFGPSRPVEEVSEAVHRLGYDTVYRTVAILSSSDCFKVRGLSEADADRLWRHSVAVAFGALFVAEDVGLDRGTLFTAGILHDLGKVVLLGIPKEPGTTADDDTPGDSGDALQREAAIYGFTHAEIGGRMMERWHFSDQLAGSVRFHHSPGAAGGGAPFAACVAVANSLAHSLDDPEGQVTATEVEAALNTLGLAPERMESYYDRIQENLRFAEMMCRR
jgi:putative nucleotidyltransferase with HDIG domain